jgi:hypothetical protein
MQKYGIFRQISAHLFYKRMAWLRLLPLLQRSTKRILLPQDGRQQAGGDGRQRFAIRGLPDRLRMKE